MASAISLRNSSEAREIDGLVHRNGLTRHILITLDGGGQNGKLSISVHNKSGYQELVRCPHCGYFLDIESGEFDPQYTDMEIEILFGGEK